MRSYSDQSECALKSEVLSVHFLIGVSMSARVKPGNKASYSMYHSLTSSDIHTRLTVSRSRHSFYDEVTEEP